MSDTTTASPVVLGRWEKPGNLAGLAALASSGQITIRPHELIRTTDGRVYHWTGTALEITSAPVHHGTVADVAALDGIYLLPSCTRGVHPGDTAYVTAAGCEYRVTAGINATATWSACASIPTIPTTPSEVGADPAGTATTVVSAHNTATDSHADIRTLVADRVPISTTRIGTVGNLPLTTTALAAADWAALPVGWRGIIAADAALASGLPASDVYHIHKVSSRDVAGGGAYQAQGYLSPTLYVGVAATSADIPTWSVALTSAPGTTVSDVGASLLALATPSSLKIPRINADGSVTLIDVPSGGGSGGSRGLYSGLMSETVPSQASTGFSTWVNQGAASLIDTSSGLQVYHPNAATAGNICGLVRAAAAAPYTVTALLEVSAGSGNYPSALLGWAAAGTTKTHVVALCGDGRSGLIYAANYSAWAFSSSNAPMFTREARRVWLRFTDAGSAISVQWSHSGAYWHTLFSAEKSAGYLGATGYTQIFFGATNWGAAVASTLLSWSLE